MSSISTTTIGKIRPGDFFAVKGSNLLYLRVDAGKVPDHPSAIGVWVPDPENTMARGTLGMEPYQPCFFEEQASDPAEWLSGPTVYRSLADDDEAKGPSGHPTGVRTRKRVRALLEGLRARGLWRYTTATIAELSCGQIFCWIGDELNPGMASIYVRANTQPIPAQPWIQSRAISVSASWWWAKEIKLDHLEPSFLGEPDVRGQVVVLPEDEIVREFGRWCAPRLYALEETLAAQGWKSPGWVPAGLEAPPS